MPKEGVSGLAACRHPIDQKWSEEQASGPAENALNHAEPAGKTMYRLAWFSRQAMAQVEPLREASWGEEKGLPHYGSKVVCGLL